MTNTQLICIAIVIIIVVIYSSYKYGCSCTENNQLQGFWETNSEFNKEAGLQTFTMYIGDYNNGEYATYFLMVEDNPEQTILINEPSNFTMSSIYSDGDCREFNIRLKDLETEMLPREMSVKYYPNTCKLVLYRYEKVYAVFFKNPVLSEMERIKKESPNIPNQKTEVKEDSESL